MRILFPLHIEEVAKCIQIKSMTKCKVQWETRAVTEKRDEIKNDP